MRIKCPVAGCSYIVKGADGGWKHWQDYDAFHKQLHRNWLNSFFHDIAELHHTLNDARAGANEAKRKAIGVANKLKENAKRYLIDHNYGRH